MNKEFFSHHRINAIILIAVGALMLWLSWGKWMDAWIDSGDDLFVQWKILQGSVLYKDIAYFRGPFPLYLNASLFKLFGTGIYTIVIAQLVMITAVAFLTYRFFLETSGILAAFMTSLVFLTLFAFPQYVWMGNFNFVCPYTYAIVDGYVFALLGLFIFLQFIKNGKVILLFFLGLVAGIVFLTKVEIFISFCLAITAGLMLWNKYLRKPDQGGIAKIIFILFTGMMIPFGSFLVYFSQQMPCTRAFHALTLQYVPNANVIFDHFYTYNFGFDKPLYNIVEMLDIFAFYLIAVVLIAAFAFIYRQAQIDRSFNKLKIFFSILLMYCLWKVFYFSFTTDIFKPLPLVVAIFCIWGQRSILKARAVTTQTVGLNVFACFALAMLIKILLRADISGYGFVLALPSVLLLVVIMVQFLPKMMDALFKGSEKLTCFLFLLLIATVIFSFVYKSKVYYSYKNLRIADGGDEFISYVPKQSDYGILFQKALDFVNTQLKPKETFLVLPEGTLLNYLSRKDTGTHYFKKNVAENDMWTEDVILQDFKLHPPDYIFYKIWKGYGLKFFGVKILSWIKTDYRQVKVLNANGQEAWIIVKRKS